MNRTRDYSVSIKKNIIEKLSDYLEKNKIKTMVLGVSGGIDSTLSAALCYEVAKRTGVKLLGYSLMCKTNAEGEVSSALNAGLAFCNEFKEVNIENWYLQSSTFVSIGTSSTDDPANLSAIALGNIKARLRMIFLYCKAGETGGIVVDTDNMTEHNTGFWTIHGDEGDVNPIGNLWKSDIYEVTDYLLTEYLEYRETLVEGVDDEEIKRTGYAVAALEDALKIVPTDGNGTSASDLDQIAPGCTYEQVDEVLKTWLSMNNDEKDLWNRGLQSKLYKMIDEIGVDMVNRILDRHKRTEYKRMHRPIKL